MDFTHEQRVVHRARCEVSDFNGKVRFAAYHTPTRTQKTVCLQFFFWNLNSTLTRFFLFFWFHATHE